MPLGYAIPSTYLPAHWMPYTLAEIAHFDYRWITFSIWATGFFVVFYRVSKSQTILVQILVALMISGTYFLITDKDWGIVSLTIETMVAGYYMILIASINQKDGYLLGIAIGICLLSRYTVALWLPLMAFVLFVSENRKLLYKSIIATTLFVTVIYVIPYLSYDWTAFYDAHMQYEKNAIGEWYHINERNLPYHLFNGVGLAQFFYTNYLKTDLHTGYNLLRSTMFFSIFVSSAILGVWYWYKRTTIDYRIFLMASFKIYLSIFLALIIVPYEYLMIVGNFVSIAVFAEQLRYKIAA
jgi:hypothetical protein